MLRAVALRIHVGFGCIGQDGRDAVPFFWRAEPGRGRGSAAVLFRERMGWTDVDDAILHHFCRWLAGVKTGRVYLIGNLLGER